MKRCPNEKCIPRDKLYASVAVHCTECGTVLVALDKCEYCETELLPTWKFCEECGRPIK